MAFPFSCKVSLVLYWFHGEMHIGIITWLLFVGLSVLGDLGTSTIIQALFGASITAISYVASSGVNIILVRRSYVSFGNVLNIVLALKASKFERCIHTW